MTSAEEPIYWEKEHTADVAVVVRGRTVQDIFIRAAYALFDQLVDLSSVGVQEHRQVEVVGESRQGAGWGDLLHNWLSELLFQASAYNHLYKEFQILELTPTSLRARVGGEQLNRERHTLRKEVKAVTYHNLRVEEVEGGWEAEVILDV